MRIVGRWHECHDGIVRPLVLAEVPSPLGQWHQLLFLIDTGADRTSLTSAFALRMGVDQSEIDAEIRFDAPRDPVTVQNLILIDAELSSAEYSTLGRDVLDLFTVILDRSRNLVALLTADHEYTLADA